MENNEQLTLEQIQEMAEKKATELSNGLGLRVIELIFEQDNEFIVGYLKQPNRHTVRAAYDRMEKYGKLDAGDVLLDACLIREESDRRILDPNPKYDSIYNWACLEAFRLIEFNISLSKKNMNLLG